MKNSGYIIILILILLINEVESGSKSDFLKSIFGRKTTTTTRAPSRFGSSSRCNSQTSQCSVYECCTSNQSCIRNRCFPRINNCPVTRDQCGEACCKQSQMCKNGQCV